MQPAEPVAHRRQHAHGVSEPEAVSGDGGERRIEAGEVEKYKEIRGLSHSLEIPVEFAMLGALNPVMLCKRLPEQQNEVEDD